MRRWNFHNVHWQQMEIARGSLWIRLLRAFDEKEKKIEERLLRFNEKLLLFSYVFGIKASEFQA